MGKKKGLTEDQIKTMIKSDINDANEVLSYIQNAADLALENGETEAKIPIQTLKKTARTLKKLGNVSRFGSDIVNDSDADGPDDDANDNISVQDALVDVDQDTD